MNQEIQNSILEAVKILATEKLKSINFTKSYTGIVKSIDFDKLTCVVEALGSEGECTIPHNLANFIDKDDIVIIQDINNDNKQKIVQGVVASTNTEMFHIYDPSTDTIVSSVMDLWDEETQQVINVTFELE